MAFLSFIRFLSSWSLSLRNISPKLISELYLSIFRGGVMIGVKGEWIIKKRNCAVPLNNRERGNQNHFSSTFHNKSHYMMSVY